MSVHRVSEDATGSTNNSNGESSDRSLSDSWTVLDSSHLKEDGDLSDAESVEVLAGDDVSAEDIFVKDRAEECSFIDGSSLSTVLDSHNYVCAAEDNEGTGLEANAETAKMAVPSSDESFLSSTPVQSSEEASQKEDKKKWFRDMLVGLALEISIISLLLDLVFLGLLGFSMAGIDHPVFPLSLKSSKSHQQFEVDPLSLQLSHVLAEWKKRSSEDHSLDRHLLKTLLLYYGESTELGANVHYLTERVQKHNDIIKYSGKMSENNKSKYYRMVLSGHLAHSVVCILSKLDSDKPAPSDLLKSVNGSEEKNDFGPEPGLWLNDWSLPQYFKANDTYHRMEAKPILPPMQNLYLHLGSTKWNQYFWDLYHRDQEIENSFEKSDESDIEIEETERSPLDLSGTGDFVTENEASGSVLGVPENPEERVGILYPLFNSDLDSEGTEDNLIENEFVDPENFFEQYGSENGFGQYVENYIEKDEFWNGNCEKADNCPGQPQQKIEISENTEKEEVFDDSSSRKALRKKKNKVKDRKRKSKSNKQDGENSKRKSKQGKREKQRYDLGETDEKKTKVKDKPKVLKFEGSGGMLNEGYPDNLEDIMRKDETNTKKLYEEEKAFDWNTRMAQGREKLRTLSERGEDRMWVFERARARRNLRRDIL